jgi:hypothetical protein
MWAGQQGREAGWRRRGGAAEDGQRWLTPEQRASDVWWPGNGGSAKKSPVVGAQRSILIGMRKTKHTVHVSVGGHCFVRSLVGAEWIGVYRQPTEGLYGLFWPRFGRTESGSSREPIFSFLTM